MDDKVKYFCKCGTELPHNHLSPCPECGRIGEVHKVIDESLSDGITCHERNTVRQKRKGFGKFMIESIQGWFPSGDPKLTKGIEMVRIIDKENKDDKKYHQIVKNVATGEIIHEEHEPLNQHKSKKKSLKEVH
jgi:hypothetical protein